MKNFFHNINLFAIPIVLIIVVLAAAGLIYDMTVSVKDYQKEVLDAQKYCIQQAIFETGTDPAKWSSSKHINAVVVLSNNSFKVQLQKPNGDAFGKLFIVYKTTDNDFVFENGDKLFDGRDLRSIEDAVMTTLNK